MTNSSHNYEFVTFHSKFGIVSSCLVAKPSLNHNSVMVWVTSAHCSLHLLQSCRFFSHSLFCSFMLTTLGSPAETQRNFYFVSEQIWDSSECKIHLLPHINFWFWSNETHVSNSLYFFLSSHHWVSALKALWRYMATYPMHI